MTVIHNKANRAEMEPKNVEKKPEAPKPEPELTASAVLFDESHARGFKNTKIDFNPQLRAKSPDAGAPNMERPVLKERGRSSGTIGRHGGKMAVAEKLNYAQRHRMKHLQDPEDHGKLHSF